jgi:hypothetical protein
MACGTSITKPWRTTHFAEAALTEVNEDIDVLRAIYVPPKRALVLTLRTWHGTATDA